MTEIDGLDVEDRIKTAAKKLRLSTYESVLYLTSPVGGLSSSDVGELKGAVSKIICPDTSRTALELYLDKEECRCLTTGCEVLDQALNGGILCHGITEISGESASGKTQFSLQLSLTAQLPVEKGGLNGGTLYICTEDAFPSKRLYQMIQNFQRRHGNTLCTSGNLGDKIFIEHVADYDGLLECLQKKAQILLQSHTVKLIVIDSVAAHFRSDYDGHEMFKRSKHISSIGSILYKYSNMYKVAVICVNQVTSSMNQEGRQLIPSLGLTWSNHVTTRIILSRTSRMLTLQQDSVQGALETVVREMEILYAPHLPCITVPYVIDHEGMKGFR